jgi:hypothetical protein
MTRVLFHMTTTEQVLFLGFLIGTVQCWYVGARYGIIFSNGKPDRRFVAR